MPIYPFFCETCGVFDLHRSTAQAAEPVHCPECRKPAARLFSPVGPATSSQAVRTRSVQNTVLHVGKKEPPRSSGHQHGRYGHFGHHGHHEHHTHARSHRYGASPMSPFVRGRLASESWYD
ncbi:zinc ribbon domain-containing protein [Brevibacillus sp. WF146]|uniref:FmdB family zinc ribbon protein n=1 Tax=Brevibacillus sp. WF146 TaxID=319501 RepID=UPI0007EC4714|nr:zinc ribbon domain-containing protein [Brevibacillus sp. WF146]UYZ13563.1 zinc ribbon domain-containing protein [Brevibacillus sp. WF146]